MFRAFRQAGLSAILALGLLTGAGPAGLEVLEASTPALTVHVYCYSNPERTVVHNNRAYAITIKTVGSLYQPYSNEPFYVYRRLAAGRTVTFYSGYAASYSSSTTLTRRFIYNNNVGTTEGARVRTTTGLVFTHRC